MMTDYKIPSIKVERPLTITNPPIYYGAVTGPMIHTFFKSDTDRILDWLWSWCEDEADMATYGWCGTYRYPTIPEEPEPRREPVDEEVRLPPPAITPNRILPPCEPRPTFLSPPTLMTTKIRPPISVTKSWLTAGWTLFANKIKSKC